MSTDRARRLTPVTGRSTAAARSATSLRPWWLAAGLGCLALVALLGVVLLAEPAPEQAPQALPPADTAATGDQDDGQAQATADEPVALPLVSYELFLARDPFEPVVPEPEPEPTDPADPADPTDPTDPTDPADPTDPSDPADPGTPGNGVANGPCTGDTEVVCDGRVLTVIEVFESNGEFVAVIEVDTMRYEVRAGDTFADVFEVVSITPDEVRVLYGDRIVRIQVGDNALK